MPTFLQFLASSLRDLLRSRLVLQMEVFALRHQLAVYQRAVRRPRLKPADRVVWSWLSHVWSGRRDALVFVQPETVIAWRRRRFREHWKRLSRSGKPGRLRVAEEVRAFIRRMSTANPLWGAPRIVAADFFVVPTVRNQVLFVFLLLAHDRRRVLHFNLTSSPTAAWTAQQMVEAFPDQDPPRLPEPRNRSQRAAPPADPPRLLQYYHRYRTHDPQTWTPPNRVPFSPSSPDR